MASPNDGSLDDSVAQEQPAVVVSTEPVDATPTVTALVTPPGLLGDFELAAPDAESLGESDLVDASANSETHPASEALDRTVPAVPASAAEVDVANTSAAANSNAAAANGAETPKKPEDFDYEPWQFEEVEPQISHRATPAPFEPFAFSPDPAYDGLVYLPGLETNIYAGKYDVPTQRPWLELFRKFYGNGPTPPSLDLFGPTNLAWPQLLVYGDYRTAIAYNDLGARDLGAWAHRLNLDMDLRITSTERVHAFIGPLDKGASFTRFEVSDGEFTFFDEFDADFDNLFFEGDLGAMLGGATGIYSPFDLPITAGYIPLVMQNGVWLEDNFLGAALTIPAKNSPALMLSNFDVTFFVGFDEINSPAFGADDSAARIWGMASFIEAYGGYIELDYAFLEDRLNQGLDYHNLSGSYTARFRDVASYSLRYIACFGQDPVVGERTADGHLFLLESSLISSKPYSFVPYANAWVGIGRPQSAARAANAGGVLRNTGILFETDGLTGYPTLDATGNATLGGAIGLNMLGDRLDHQLVLEFAALHVLDPADAVAVGDQCGVGFRYQHPITNSWLVRTDGMLGLLASTADIAGLRVELRKKF